MVPAAPLDTDGSSNANFHRLKQPSEFKLVLAPGPALWLLAGIFIVTSVAAFIICSAKASSGATAAFTCGLLFLGLGFGIAAFIYHRFGMRATFDKMHGEIVVAGYRYTPPKRLSLGEVCAVQFCDAGIRGKDESWHSYQVNLVTNRDKPKRINLLDSAGEKKLKAIADQLATFLNVPLFIGDRRIN